MIQADKNPPLLNEFLDYCLVYQHKSVNSVDQYNCDLNMFLRYMKFHFKEADAKELDEIDIRNIDINFLGKIQKSDIHAFISYLSINRQCGPATCARKISTIRIFFKYLTVTTNNSEKLLINTMNDEDNANKERDYCIITLFLNCGMRLSELVGINISDIKFDDCLLTVIGKGNKERTIYLNKACMSAIKDYLNIRNGIQGLKDDKSSDKALFLSGHRKRISKRTVEYIVTKELNRAGLDTTKYSTHKLRHTAATLMYKYGQVDIRALQQVLGHESISTTEIYTHVDNEQIRNAIEDNPLSNFKP